MTSPQPDLPDLPVDFDFTDLPHNLDPVGPDFVPETPQDMVRALASWRWRIFSGRLYKIMTKQDDDDEAEVVPFVPNMIQTHFVHSLHHRNVILKARQLGFTTLICILWLDHALFNRDQRCGIVAHNLEDAEAFFRDKILFAYLNLPDALRNLAPLKKHNTKEILFAHNNSGVRVSTSMRSGTIHRLHVSEMGKMAARHPEKAKEVVTGSLPAVPQTGVAIIESTAEGRDGEFYTIARRAQDRAEDPAPLNPKEFRFHFYPWWTERKYRINPNLVRVSDEDHEYFDRIEIEMDCLLTPGQRAWYVATRDHEFGGDQEKMWQEHPSTPEECWQKSSKGHYYNRQLAAVRRQNRIRLFEPDPYLPAYTFWDIGNRDGAGVWVMQVVGEEHRFLRYIQGWNEGFAFYTQQLIDMRLLWAQHYLPHDARQQRQTQEGVICAHEILESMLPEWVWVVLGQIDHLQSGIEVTRKHFPRAVFHAEGCKEGLDHLGNYQQRWNPAVGAWANEPLKNEATEAADSFRQWAQAVEAGAFQIRASRPRHRTKATVL
jgi:hypothetical protein